MVRIGFLWEKVVTMENCRLAVKRAILNKKKTKRIKYIKSHIGRTAAWLLKLLKSGAWQPHPFRTKQIYDERRHKWRSLKIPCLEDQFVHHAIMNVVAPLIARRSYYYSCGAMPGKGQTLACSALKKWMKNKYVKWAYECDIHKFYDSVRREEVMKALRRFIKDETVLLYNQMILDSMGDFGLAIGFYPSPWYANLVLTRVDIAAKADKRVKFVRYVDDIRMVSSNKRALRRAVQRVTQLLAGMGLSLKRDWQLFPMAARCVRFLSYRFFRGYTILRKWLMYRIARFARNIRKGDQLHKARVAMSYKGILKACNSWNFKTTRYLKFVHEKYLRRLISHADTLHNAPAAA